MTGLLTTNAVWRATGLRAAGRAVLRALDSRDPNVRTIAGMLLVRAGPRAEGLLREAVATRRHLATVATIIGDVGDPRLRPLLLELAADRDRAVADAARDALRALDRNAAGPVR